MATQASAKDYGFNLGETASPTEKGWACVSPQVWEFRNKELSDKIITDSGYANQKVWIDCTKALFMVEAWEKSPQISPMQLGVAGEVKFIDHCNPVIRHGEVVPGISAMDQHGIPWDPTGQIASSFRDLGEEGYLYKWDFEKNEKVPLPEEDAKRIERFMEARNYQYYVKEALPEKLFNMLYAPQFLRYWEASINTPGTRVNYDYNWIFKMGNSGILNELKITRERLQGQLVDFTTPSVKAGNIVHRIGLVNGMIEVVEAMGRWFGKYADKARELLKKEKDAWQKNRLERIAESCDWLVEKPPRNLFDAAQFFEIWWEAGAHMETSSHSIQMRFDQTFYPFFKQDVLEKKTLARQEAADIIATVMMKMCEHGQPVSKSASRLYGLGTRDYISLIIGGQTADGHDAWNELTDLVLDVLDGYRLHYPDMKVRWHKATTRNQLSRVMEISRTGMGLPSVKSDEVMIPMMLKNYGDECTLEEARDYAIQGCITPASIQNSKMGTIRTATFIPYTKWLEMTIHKGVDPEPGWEWADIREWIDFPEEYKTFDEFYQQYLKVMQWVFTIDARCRQITLEAWMAAVRRPLCSAGIPGCVKEGVDNYELDIPRWSFHDTTGWVDSIDSMTAVKKLIFEDKKYTWDEMVTALKTDWEGYEGMQKAFKDAPKYGNDDDYADMMYRNFTEDIYDLCKEGVKSGAYTDPRGKIVMPNGLIVTTMFACSFTTGALPNGRKRADYLADGSQNPHGENDKSGAWARLNSLLKQDLTCFKSTIYNQKIDYPSVAGDAGLEKLVDYVQTAMIGGCEQMQPNFIGEEVLRDAQKKPEKYPFLSVRISGYSAYFTKLPTAVQNAVIERVDNPL